MVSILFAGGLHAQSQFGRRYLEGYAVRNMGVQGPGTDIWMLHSLFDSGQADVRVVRVDSTGHVLGAYGPDLPGYYYVEGQDMVYSGQDRALTVAGSGYGDSLAPLFLSTGILMQWNDSGGVNFLHVLQMDSGHVILDAVDSCTAGSLVVAGSYSPAYGPLLASDAYIARIRRLDGSLICATGFGGTGLDAANDVAVVPGQNQVVAVGQTENFGVAGNAIYIMVTDTLCNALWSLLIDGPQDDWANKVIADGNGIWVWGSTGSFSTYDRGLVARIGLNGVLQGCWTIDLGLPTDVTMDNATALPDGGFLFSANTGIQQSFLGALDSMMAVQWVRVVDDGNPEHGVFVGNGLSCIHYFTVCADTVNNETDAVLYRLGMQGEAPLLCPVHDHGVYAFGAVSMGSHLMLGDAHPVALLDAIVMAGSAVDSLHAVDVCDAYAGSEGARGQGLVGDGMVELEVMVAPNPTAGGVRVLLSHGLVKEGRLRVYDFAGRVVMEVAVAVGVREVELDLSGLTGGVYGAEVVGAGLRRVARVVRI